MRFSIEEYIEKGYLEPIEGGYFVKKETPNEIKKELSISDDEYFETFGERMFFFSKKNTEMAKDSLWSKIKRVVSDLNPWPRQEGGLFGYAPVDLTEEFNGPSPTIHYVEQFVKDVLKKGSPYATFSPDWFIKMPNGRYRIGHIVHQNGWEKMSAEEKATHNRYVVAFEKIAKNAVHCGEEPNKDPNDKHKKNVLKYHYFKSLIKIKDKTFTVFLDTEQFKNDSEELPRTVSLYNIRSGNTA